MNLQLLSFSWMLKVHPYDPSELAMNEGLFYSEAESYSIFGPNANGTIAGFRNEKWAVFYKRMRTRWKRVVVFCKL